MIRFFKSFFSISVLLCLLFFTWVLSIYHLGVFKAADLPQVNFKQMDVNRIAQWQPRNPSGGINQLVLEGNALERGYAAGIKTRALLKTQEASLIERLKNTLPNPLLRNLFIVGLIRWFYGIDHYLERQWLEEMYGVSQSASSEYNYLADPYVRQIAYHGLHEVGQMFVDFGSDFGCTVFAIPVNDSWVIGRNFDFEGGRIFDEDKILKWVFPDKGNAFVSVIFAGMVGAVSGVNDKGVYVSINAAGSKDFKRYGTPSTLVALKVLQEAPNVEEARQIIQNAQMFITDIFVVADSNSPVIYRIEKSPQQSVAIPLTEASAITNHLLGSPWAKDFINLYRKNNLTSQVRLERAEVLLAELAKKQLTSTSLVVENVLAFLRDKKNKQGVPYPLGNRKAIDALIATHSVIYDGKAQNFYVSQGPSLVGPFLGYDLAQSFRLKKPQRIRSLPGDPEISSETYYRTKEKLLRRNYGASP